MQGFFWLKETGNAAGKRTGIDALATALSLAAKDGSGWESLAEFAADETAAPYPDRPNTVCSPAGPDFNPQDLEKLAETTKTDIGDWGFTAQEGVEVHAAGQQNSPVIEKLGMQFVRVMPDTAPNASQDFMRIVTPSGKVGFVAAEAINPLGSDQLCFGKDAGRSLEDRRHDRRRVARNTARAPYSASRTRICAAIGPVRIKQA